MTLTLPENKATRNVKAAGVILRTNLDAPQPADLAKQVKDARIEYDNRLRDILRQATCPEHFHLVTDPLDALVTALCTLHGVDSTISTAAVGRLQSTVDSLHSHLQREADRLAPLTSVVIQSEEARSAFVDGYPRITHVAGYTEQEVYKGTRGIGWLGADVIYLRYNAERIIHKLNEPSNVQEMDVAIHIEGGVKADSTIGEMLEHGPIWCYDTPEGSFVGQDAYLEGEDNAGKSGLFHPYWLTSVNRLTLSCTTLAFHADQHGYRKTRLL